MRRTLIFPRHDHIFVGNIPSENNGPIVVLRAGDRRRSTCYRKPSNRFIDIPFTKAKRSSQAEFSAKKTPKIFAQRAREKRRVEASEEPKSVQSDVILPFFAHRLRE